MQYNLTVHKFPTECACGCESEHAPSNTDKQTHTHIHMNILNTHIGIYRKTTNWGRGDQSSCTTRGEASHTSKWLLHCLLQCSSFLQYIIKSAHTQVQMKSWHHQDSHTKEDTSAPSNPNKCVVVTTKCTKHWMTMVGVFTLRFQRKNEDCRAK